VLFLRAYVEGGQGFDDAPEYLRSVGLALRELNLQELALAVTLGALERDPTRPSVLETLGVQYERMERWVDAIRARDTLIELLKTNLPVQFRQEPELDMSVIAPAKAEEDVRAINERLRRQFAVILPDDEVSEADYAMSVSNYPPGLHTLVGQLSARQNPDSLLEVAQRLWAVARHDGLGDHLRPEVLAATVQWLAERLTWRLPTSHERLHEAYGVEADQIRAAARLLVSRYDSPLLPISVLAPRLSTSELALLRKLVSAILLDVGLEEVEPRTLF
jgi:tetratricopeptide (TPR) repeat protein